MPKFGTRSLESLNTAHEDLQNLFKEVVKTFDCSVIEGFRDEERQNSLYHSGYSKAKYAQSRHNVNPSNAVDVVPYPVDWDDANRFYLFAGYVLSTANRLGINVKWGGDWDGDLDIKDNLFNDLAHWELK